MSNSGSRILVSEFGTRIRYKNLLAEPGTRFLYQDLVVPDAGTRIWYKILTQNRVPDFGAGLWYRILVSDSGIRIRSQIVEPESRARFWFS